MAGGYDPVRGNEAAAAGVVEGSILFILQGDLAAGRGVLSCLGPARGVATPGCIG